MAAAAPTGRLLALCLFILVQCVCCQYRIPPVRIQVFKPKGFQASIEDAPNLALFTFQGNINRGIGSTDVGEISGEVTEPSNGRWTVEDPNVQLRAGDVIQYHVFAAVNSKGYVADGLNYTVDQLEDRGGSSSSPADECRPTKTLVRGGTACAGQIIFEDHFNSLRESVWQIEQFIPVLNPEYPFNSYQRVPERPTVSTNGGYLQISPTLQQDLSGFSSETISSGTLNLFSGCTAPAEACTATASGADILPPVVSGRITSKFAFTYGTVEIRAKLPQGDWLYPDILLEPFLKKYGSQHYASGVLRIAGARGNRQLGAGSTDYSNRVLYGGPIMDFQCHGSLLSSKTSPDGRLWGDDYHVYSVRWAPERITLAVDGAEWARVEPAASGLAGRVSRACAQLPRDLLAMGGAMAPFDDHFYLSLGVAAGSITEFPDGAVSASGPKPWTNTGRKATLAFWQDIASWNTSWHQTRLSVDYVKVTAL